MILASPPYVVIVSPIGSDDDSVKINQDSWFALADLGKGKNVDYTLHDKAHGVYVFVIDGDVTVNGTKLNKKDGLGVSETEALSISADSDSKVLLMEVPML